MLDLPGDPALSDIICALEKLQLTCIRDKVGVRTQKHRPYSNVHKQQMITGDAVIAYAIEQCGRMN